MHEETLTACWAPTYVANSSSKAAHSGPVVSHPELPNLPVARAVWEPVPSLATSAECWLEAGGPHHTVLSAAIGVEELTDFAAMVGTELALIDAGTTHRAFRNELRWNAAAYKLGL